MCLLLGHSTSAIAPVCVVHLKLAKFIAELRRLHYPTGIILHATTQAYKEGTLLYEIFSACVDILP